MQNLSIYLNDHLAGSVAALELMDHLIETSGDPSLALFLKALREEIDADQSVLENLIRQLGQEESAVRKASAWVLEKMSRAKLEVGTGAGMGVFQALEGLSLGITGKRSLWRNLAVSVATMPILGVLDYRLLEERAADQFQRVEAKCRELAPAVLKSE